MTSGPTTFATLAGDVLHTTREAYRLTEVLVRAEEGGAFEGLLGEETLLKAQAMLPDGFLAYRWANKWSVYAIVPSEAPPCR